MKQILQGSLTPKKQTLGLCLLISTASIIGGCAQTLPMTDPTSSASAQDGINGKDTNAVETTNDDTGPTINDPLEPLNRGIYFVNMGIDGIIIKPLALAYRFILPEPVRNSVGNFYVNLHSPISFSNHLLQGNPSRACNSLIRFALNSTMGILGLFDAAETLGYKSNETGFGETLGVWGVNTGPYLMLPALGPSSFRGVAGKVGDYFLQPYNYYFMTSTNDDDWASWTLLGVDMVHQRHLYIESVDELVANSIDPYVTFRSIYFQQLQHRLNELKTNP